VLATYAVGVLAVVAMSVAWVAVQAGWKRVFADVASDPDALACRPRCRDCCGDCEREPGGAGECRNREQEVIR
jgi:hypothetical protein